MKEKIMIEEYVNIHKSLLQRLSQNEREYEKEINKETEENKNGNIVRD